MINMKEQIAGEISLENLMMKVHIKSIKTPRDYLKILKDANKVQRHPIN